jgi:tetratricopeptide (TPR) repeat protein
LPVILNDANICKKADKLKYIKYWKEEYDNVCNASKQLQTNSTWYKNERPEHYQNVLSIMEEFINKIKCIPHQTLDELINTNYRAILECIGFSCTDPRNELLEIYSIRDVYKQEASIDNFIFRHQDFATGYFFKGIIKYYMRDYYGAIESFSSAIELNPGYAGAYNSRGVVYDILGENNKSIDDFTNAGRLDPFDPGIYFNRKLIYDRIGDNTRSVENYVKAIDNYLIAIDVYSKAILSKPNNADMYNTRGVLYNNISEFDSAINDFTKAVELNPYCADAYYNRGIAYNRKGCYTRAVEDFRNAAKAGSKQAINMLREVELV